MSNATEFSRFDIPAAVRDFLKVAEGAGVADAASVFALAMTHGTDWNAIIDEVVGWAFANRHVDDSHKIVAPAADKARVAVKGLTR